MPFRRILVPTDFSTASEWVFHDAVRLAAAHGAEIVILHVRMTWASSPDQLRFPADPALYAYAEQLELDRLRERAQRVDSSVKTRMIVRKAPDPGAEICRVAEDEDIDLIVMATHARHHVAHLLVGSTTLSLIEHLPAPLLVIRYGTRHRDEFRRTVVLIEPEGSLGAVDLARDFGGETHLVAVCNEETRPACESRLRDAAARLPGARHVLLVSDDPEEETVRYASRIDADAILLSDATASEGKLDMVRHASVPIVVVPDAG